MLIDPHRSQQHAGLRPNPGHLVSEATGLPAVPQPQPTRLIPKTPQRYQFKSS